MKKILLGMMAASMMFATSCQNEEFADGGNLSTVSFNVGTPEIASRAYSDGMTATHLQYAVYDADGKELTDLTVTDATINGSTTVNLQLTTGNTYSVIFWAAAPNAPYTVDLANKSMTVDYTGALSNDEYRDAFYAKKDFTVTGAQTETIELKRPFAQLNIGVGDYVASTNAGYTPTKSAVTVKNIYNTLNLWDGTVTGSNPVTYDYAAIPTNETFPVAGYEYLSMNYLLVDTAKALVEVEFGYTKTDSTAAKTRTVGSVPVQRNYRTNIYGNLLTSDVDVNVEIKPGYDGSHEAEALFLAAAVGGTVTLTEDVTLNEALVVTANMTLNLNGKNITINTPYDSNNYEASSAIVNNANLTLIGNGTIKAKNNYTVRNNGTMVIDGVTIENGIMNFNDLTIENGNISNSRSGKHGIYGNNAKLTINGGKFHNENAGNATIFSDGGEVIINNGEFTIADGTSTFGWTSCLIDAQGGAIYTLNGGNIMGEIRDYNKNTKVYGGVYTHSSVKNFVADGYKAIEKDGLFYVVSNDIAAIVSSNEDFATSLMNGGTIILNKGEYTFPAGNVFAGEVKVIAAEGAKVVVNLPKSTYIPGTQLTLEGLTFTTPAGLTYTEGAFGFIHHAAEFNMNNCVIEGGRLRLNVAKANIDKCQFNVTASSGFDGYGLFYYGNNGSTINVSNSTFTALQKAIVLYNETSVNMNLNVDNCTFTASQTTDKAAISIHSELGINGTVNITNSTATGFANHHGGLWRDVNNNNGQDNKNFTVTVDGEIAAVKGFGAINKGYYAIGDTYTVLSGEGFKAVATEVLSDASKNITIELAKNIDLTNIEWPAVRTNAEFVLDGKGYSIMNLTTSAVEDHGFYSTAMFTSTRKAATIKNLIVENATVTGNGMANSHGAVLVACNYSSLNISGVTVKNSTVSNCDRSAVITTYLYFTDATVENCVVEGCTVNSIGTAGAILGMNNSKNFEATGNKVKDTTISSSEGNNKAGILIGTWQNAGTLTEEGNTVENSKAINAGTETNNNIGRTV